jgi:hypothetical protein
LKRNAAKLALMIFSMAVLLTLCLNNQVVGAQSSGYTIQHVDHNVQVLYSGHVVITERIQLSGQIPSTFEIGLPFKYSAFLLKGFAYDESLHILPVTTGVQLQDKSGFSGSSVSLPSGTSNVFTVIFVLSNGVLNQTSTGYDLDFPAYLAFVQPVADYNVTLTVPPAVTVVGIEKPDGVVNATSFNKLNLVAFTYSPAKATLATSYGDVQKVNIISLSRELNIGPSGAIRSLDIYRILNNSSFLTSFIVNLPISASNVVARDQFGKLLSTSVYENTSLRLSQNITLSVPMEQGESNILTVEYSLPKVSPESGRYGLSLDLFSYFNYFVDSASVSVVPPEGATFVAPTLSQLNSAIDLSRDIFQEKLVVKKEGVSYIDSIIPTEDILTVSYEYNSLWIGFRPTSWAWVVAMVGIVIVAIWRRPKSKPVTVSKTVVARSVSGETLSPEKIREFIEAYEEKSSVSKELRTLEARAQHGRIPRRRYKVQRQTLEGRLETLSQTISQLRDPMMRAGGSYADISRRLEAADVEINEVQLSLQTIEVRHESGEISLEVYRKQLSDLEKRKEKAESTVAGLLSRLR